MNQSSFIISNKRLEQDKEDYYLSNESGNCHINLRKIHGNRIHQYETQDHSIFICSNPGFHKECIGEKGQVRMKIGTIENMLVKMQWGFVMIIPKNTSKVILYNDLYGIFPIYHYHRNDCFILSDSFTEISRHIENLTIDYHAISDYFLLNYTLNDRTLTKEIHRLEGGSRLEISNGGATVNKITDIAEYIMESGYAKINYSSLQRSLVENIRHNIIPGKKINLALSGGFDSKVALAILMSSGEDFSAFTFGAKGSIDHKAAMSIAEQFHLHYQLIEINDESFSSANDLILTFIDKNPALPMILDLISYEYVNRKIPPSNLVTGIMGGELIAGPVVISEVILTRSAKVLITSNTVRELSSGLQQNYSEIPFLNDNFFSDHLRDYLQTLEKYRPLNNDNHWKNLTNFLLNETYAKFFGVVFNSVAVNHNLINPFVDIDFLRQLLNSRLRYTRMQPFSKNPAAHFRSRRLYPNLIEKIYKPALFTMMDRDYMLADIYYWHRFPRSIFRYIQNHYLMKNRAEKLKTLNYMKWFRKFLIMKLENSEILEFPFINKKRTTDLLKVIRENHEVPDYTIRKLIMLLGFHYFHEKFKHKIYY